MKRVLLVMVVLLVASVPGIFGMDKDAAKEPQIIPYFIGLGFAGKSGGDVASFVPCELNVQMILPPKGDPSASGNFPTPGQSGNSAQAEKTFRGFFRYGDRGIPVKVIQSELARFEADLIQISSGGKGKEPNMVPVGHISLKALGAHRSFNIVIGKLMIQTEEMDKNEEMTLLMHDITGLHVMATKKASEADDSDKAAPAPAPAPANPTPDKAP